MTLRRRLRRPGLSALLPLAAIGAFSVGYSILAKNDLWPRLRPGALHDTDLVAGFAAALALAGMLLRAGRRTPEVAAGGGSGPQPEGEAAALPLPDTRPSDPGRPAPESAELR